MSFIHRRLASSPPAQGGRLCVFIHLHSICKIRCLSCADVDVFGYRCFAERLAYVLCLYLWIQIRVEMRAAHLCRERIWLRTEYFRGGGAEHEGLM